MALEVKTQANLLKGLNLATGKATEIPGTIRRNSNLLYSKRGSLVTTDGARIYVSYPDLWGGTSESFFVWIGELPNGPLGLFPAALTAGFDPTLKITFGPFFFDISTNPPTQRFDSPIGAVGTTVATLPFLFGVNNFTVILYSNIIIPQYYDFYNRIPPVAGTPVNTYQLGGGTAANPLAPVLGAAHGVFHGGYCYLWNTYSYKNQNDGPNVLRACALSTSGLPDLSNFPTTFIASVDADDGQQGRGCISFTSSEQGIAPTPILVLFKDYKTFQVSGKFGDGSLSITRAQTDMGCIAPRSLQFVPGFGIIRLSHFGVTLFDGVKDEVISEEIRPYLFQTEPDISPINWAAASFIVSVVTVNPPMYVMAVPVVGTGDPLLPFPYLSRLLCYDLVLKAWTVVDLPKVAGRRGVPRDLVHRDVEAAEHPAFTVFGDAPIQTGGPTAWTLTGSNAGGALATGSYVVILTATGMPGYALGESGPTTAKSVFVTGPTASFTVSGVTLPAGATGYRIYVAYFLDVTSDNKEDRYVAVAGSGSFTVTNITIGGGQGFVAAPIVPSGDGGLRRWLGGDQTWDNRATAINWSTRLPEVFGKSPDSRVFFRRTALRVRISNVKVTAVVNVGGVQLSKSSSLVYVPLVPGALYGTALYGFAVYGDAYPDLVKFYDVGITGASANVAYSGSGYVELMSNSWHVVQRPEGGAMRVS